ncbi:MAG: 3-hydroxybutyryl-CoA dehydrogenase [Bacteriovoracaceae bacterium]|nr:3-hydroxybutyryl-CoA dehydrogenase [Bacteriovoracaceae bacterium]
MELKKVVVIGAGTMGQGIAQWFVQQGIQTELADINEKQVRAAIENMSKSWDKLEKKGKFTSSQTEEFNNNIQGVDTIGIFTDADLVIEAIIEDEKIKNDLFMDLDARMSKQTIFATNTSSIPVSTIAKNLSSERQKKFLGLHFFNPAPIMKLVEVIDGHWTDRNISTSLFDWFQSKGKKPAKCKDSPGFIVNRLARNYYGEAFRILQSENKEKISEIDNVMKSVGGFKMGPFELMDLIGIDVNLDVSTSVWNSFYQEPRFSPHRIQKFMVESGRLGRKSKKGFYDYE